MSGGVACFSNRRARILLVIMLWTTLMDQSHRVAGHPTTYLDISHTPNKTMSILPLSDSQLGHHPDITLQNSDRDVVKVEQQETIGNGREELKNDKMKDKSEKHNWDSEKKEPLLAPGSLNNAQKLKPFTGDLTGQSNGVKQEVMWLKKAVNERNMCKSVCTICSRLGAPGQSSLCLKQCTDVGLNVGMSVFEYCLDLWNQSSYNLQKIFKVFAHGEERGYEYETSELRHATKTSPARSSPCRGSTRRQSGRVGDDPVDVKDKIDASSHVQACKTDGNNGMRDETRRTVGPTGERVAVGNRRRYLIGRSIAKELHHVTRRHIGWRDMMDSLDDETGARIGREDRKEKEYLMPHGKLSDGVVSEGNVKKRNMCRSVCTLCERIGSASHSSLCHRECIDNPSNSLSFDYCLGLWQTQSQ